MLRLVLIVLLVLLLVGGLPNWGWHSYGWYPSGGAGLLLVVLVVLVLVKVL